MLCCSSFLSLLLISAAILLGAVVALRRVTCRALEQRNEERKRSAKGILAQTDGFRVHDPIRVAFLHPDLGIGGAERLIVDAAMGLQKVERKPIPSSPNGILSSSSSLAGMGVAAGSDSAFSSNRTSRAVSLNATQRSLGGSSPPPQSNVTTSPPTGPATLRSHRRFDVQLFTNYHDPNRAFSETVDGTLKPILVVGNWIPRHIKNKGHVLFASLRMIFAGIVLVLKYQLSSATAFDVIIVDQVAAVMPFLKLVAPSWPIYFYCHFPDQLCDPNRMVDLNDLIDEKAQRGRGGDEPLQTEAEKRKDAEREARNGKLQQQKMSFMQRARHCYRTVFDQIEVLSMKAADRVNYNSKFSLSVTLGVFPFLKETLDLDRDILYPPIDIEKALTCPPLPSSSSSFGDSSSSSDRNPKVDGFCDVREADFVRFLKTHRVVTSINRFERKKNIGLAIETVGHYASTIGYDATTYHKNGRSGETNGRDGSAIPISAPLLSGGDEKSHLPLALIVCGGYDPRLPENVEHHAELLALCEDKYSNIFLPITSITEYEGIVRKEMTKRVQRAAASPTKDSNDTSPTGEGNDFSESKSTASFLKKIPVLFLRSCTSRAKYLLLENASVVLYTPEHFGIVPVEAMCFGVPVVAVANGGPVESIGEGDVNGLLRTSEPSAFAEAMGKALDPHISEQISEKAAARARAVFGLTSFATRMAAQLEELIGGE